MVTLEIMEREVRRDTVDSLVCRVCPDLPVQLVNREPLVSSDQVAKGDLPDPLGHQERKDTLDSQDQWDLQEHVESVERSDLRDHQEKTAHRESLAHPDPPPPPWKTCSEVTTTTSTPAPLLLLSSARTRPCPSATGPPSCRSTPGYRLP